MSEKSSPHRGRSRAVHRFNEQLKRLSKRASQAIVKKLGPRWRAEALAREGGVTMALVHEDEACEAGSAHRR
jgi:hypothetical protein